MNTQNRHCHFILVFSVNFRSNFGKALSEIQQDLLNENLHLDKSYEIFKSTNLLEQRHKFKLKCDFRQIADVNLLNETIKWYKVVSTNGQANNIQISSNSNELSVYEYETAKMSNVSSQFEKQNLISDLKFKNINNLNSIGSTFMCQLTNSSLKFTQKISLNEMVNTEWSTYKLNYSITQTTQSRIIFEIYSLKSNKIKPSTSTHENLMLIYSLININIDEPTLKGSIQIQMHTNSTQYLVLEGLASNTNYNLLVYIKADNQVELVLNRTLSTLSLDDSNKDADLINDQYYINDELFESEDDMIDDSVSLANSNRKQIISCAIHKTSQTEPRTFNKYQRQNQLVTIDYSSSNMNKLLESSMSFNSTDLQLNEIIVNTSYFQDFFDLIQFNKETFDYSINYDCLKQSKNTQKQHNLFLRTQPLCLFNLASTWQALNDNDPSDDQYNVQTSIKFNEKYTVYIASVCEFQIRPPNVFNLLNQIKSKSNKKHAKKSEKLINLNSIGSNNQTLKSAMLPFIQISSTNSILNKFVTQSAMPFLKQSTSLLNQQVPSSSLTSLAINDCLIKDDNNEMQFRIDHNGLINPNNNAGLLSLSASKPNDNFYYQIQVLVPSSGYMKSSSRTISNQAQSLSFNFTIKKENNSQVSRKIVFYLFLFLILKHFFPYFKFQLYIF